MQISPQIQSKNLSQHDEMILVVKRSTLLQQPWHGLEINNLANFTKLIHEHKEFHPRWQMEQDEQYKQIVSYMIFRYENSVFLMQRKTSASEQRLKSKLSLGIGGHLRQEDVKGTSLVNWVEREFHEEINYSGQLEYKLIGLINDDSNSVGRVHVGLVFLLDGNSPNISIKSELKQGNLIPQEELKNYYDDMESWSQIITNYLTRRFL